MRFFSNSFILFVLTFMCVYVKIWIRVHNNRAYGWIEHVFSGDLCECWHKCACVHKRRVCMCVCEQVLQIFRLEHTIFSVGNHYYVNNLITTNKMYSVLIAFKHVWCYPYKYTIITSLNLIFQIHCSVCPQPTGHLPLPLICTLHTFLHAHSTSVPQFHPSGELYAFYIQNWGTNIFPL